MSSLIRRAKQRIKKRALIWVVICCFALIGSIALLRSQAATTNVRVEAENGVTTGNASKRDNSSASGGKVVVFSPPIIKPALRGFLDDFNRVSSASSEYKAIVDEYFVNIEWNDIEPTQTGGIVRSVIDSKINKIKLFDPNPDIKLRVRVGPAGSTPDWVKNDPGVGTFQLYKEVNGDDGARITTMPRFWTPAFKAHYNSLQNKLAAIYDDPSKDTMAKHIVQTTISRCMTEYPETFNRNLPREGSSADAFQNFVRYFNAGFTTALDKTCHEEQIDAHAVWKYTRTGIALNPYKSVTYNPSNLLESTVSNDYAFTQNMMKRCRDNLGERCVLENYSIRYPIYPDTGYCAGAPAGDKYSKCFNTAGDMGKMYADLANYRPIKSYQSAMPALIGDWQAAYSWFIDRGANSIELNSGARSYDLSILSALDRRLESNPVN